MPFNQPLGGNEMPRFGGPVTFMRLPAAASAQGLDVAFTGIPRELAEWVNAMHLSPYALIGMLTVVYLILGTALAVFFVPIFFVVLRSFFKVSERQQRFDAEHAHQTTGESHE